MDITFKSLLPIKVQKLVNKIESFSNCEILVKEMKGEKITDDIFPMQITISYHHAELKYDPRENIDPNSVLHELLHLERFWINKIPQLQPYNKKNEKITANIDNQYEHLIIIPLEKKYGYDPTPFWEEKLLKLIKKGFIENENILSKKAKMLFGYIQSKYFIFSKEVFEKLMQIINNYSIFDDINETSDKILKRLDNKKECILQILKFLSIPVNEVYFETLIIKERKTYKMGLI